MANTILFLKQVCRCEYHVQCKFKINVKKNHGLKIMITINIVIKLSTVMLPAVSISNQSTYPCSFTYGIEVIQPELNC